MRQAITVEQYEALPEPQREAIYYWAKKHGYHHLLTIGQMLEFLFEKHGALFLLKTYWNSKRKILQWKYLDDRYIRDEMKDALWDACRDELAASAYKSQVKNKVKV
jgi:hypothetical protein